MSDPETPKDPEDGLGSIRRIVSDDGVPTQTRAGRLILGDEQRLDERLSVEMKPEPLILRSPAPPAWSEGPGGLPVVETAPDDPPTGRATPAAGRNLKERVARLETALATPRTDRAGAGEHPGNVPAADAAEDGEGRQPESASDAEPLLLRPSAGRAAEPVPPVDEAAIRELVVEIVRQELQGVLGERITRNLRKLVRREIARSLAPNGSE